MKLLTAGISLGLVSLAALTVPAGAADMPGQRGSSKDYGQAAVPVPAPVPYEDHYKWYIGAGVGFAARSSGDISATSSIEVTPFADQNGPAYGSIVAGRYLTPSLRVELGMDFRAKQKIANATPYNYDVTYTTAGAASVANPAINTLDYNHYLMTHTEKAHLTSNTYMLSAFYEFMPGRKLRPFVGAGIGFATHDLQREMVESGRCDYGGNFDPVSGVDILTGCHSTTDLPATVRTTSGGSALGIGLAASLMAGATYDLTARTHLDVGYRLMYMGSKTVVTLPDSFGAFSTINVGSRVDHELRTAVRFDLW